MLNDDTQEVVTSTNDDETSVDTETDETGTQDWEAEAKKWRAIAERKAKKLETQPAQDEKPTVSTTGLSEEDIIVITELKDKQLIDTAREIAKLKGMTLAEAAGTTMFKLAKQEIDEERRQESVKMEASRGSGARGKKKDFTTTGLSKDEHKELWKRKMGR